MQQVISALTKNNLARETDLIIFSDGARDDADRPGVDEVRAYLSKITGFKSIRVEARDKNFGLSYSIVAGISDVLLLYDDVIVIEDDIVVSNTFLDFMNEALDFFRGDDRVISVSGYNLPMKKGVSGAFFLKGADCWGWATWRRGWHLYNADGRFLLEELKKRGQCHEFDFNGTSYHTEMLARQISGKNDSWAIRWHASAFLLGKLTLYPAKSLVLNIGNDGTGTHCETDSSFNGEIGVKPSCLHSLVIEESRAGRLAVEEFYRATYSPYLGTMKRLIKKIILKNTNGKT